MIDADSLVQSFLKAARGEKIAAMVVYGLMAEGRPVMRVSSNTDAKSTQGILNWLARVDERTIEACARALHEDDGGLRCYVCSALNAMTWNDPAHSPGWVGSGSDIAASPDGETPLSPGSHRAWEQVHEFDRERHRAIVRVVLEVARALAGRSLNVKTA